MPRSATNFTASSLNSRENVRLPCFTSFRIIALNKVVSTNQEQPSTRICRFHTSRSGLSSTVQSGVAAF